MSKVIDLAIEVMYFLILVLILLALALIIYHATVGLEAQLT
jgi:hypothetical protein